VNMPDRQYLVNYGQGGFLGRYQSSLELERGLRVAIQSPRGLELGTVLSESGSSANGPALEGEILRRATTEDDEVAAKYKLQATDILQSAQQYADSSQLPLIFLDGEVLLDGRSAILQAIHWDDCDATSLFEAISKQHGLHVQLADLTATPKPATGCSTCGSEKSGCDSCGTGGGCSTGSCSKGSVKSADELTSYFSGLRKQMEASNVRIPIG